MLPIGSRLLKIALVGIDYHLTYSILPAWLATATALAIRRKKTGEVVAIFAL